MQNRIVVSLLGCLLIVCWQPLHAAPPAEAPAAENNQQPSAENAPQSSSEESTQQEENGGEPSADSGKEGSQEPSDEPATNDEKKKEEQPNSEPPTENDGGAKPESMPDEAPKETPKADDAPKEENKEKDDKSNEMKPDAGDMAEPKSEEAKPADEESDADGKADEKETEEKKKPAPPEPRRAEWNDKVAKVLNQRSPKSIDDLKVIQTQLQRVVTAATPATVSVRVGNSFGSGVIVSADGLVLTAGHVVGRPNASALFIFSDGSTARGKTLGMNQDIDSGMMKITDKGPWPFVEMAKSTPVQGGQWVVAIGHPGGFDAERTPPVRLGRVLFANRNVINTDCTLVGGDSGGPLFNMQGQVVGIHSRIGGQITNNYHVPIATYHDTWDRLAAAERWGSRIGGKEPVRAWPYLGLSSKRNSDRCEITQVYPGRPAARAGMKAGDVIQKFAGKPVDSAEALGELLAKQRPRSRVDVEVLRGEEVVKLKVLIGMTNRRIPGSYQPTPSAESEKKPG